MDISESELSDLVLKYSRDINLLVDEKKPIALGALNNLLRLFENKETASPLKLAFFQTKILKNFLLTIDSSSDSVRESALKLIAALNVPLSEPGLSSRLSSETKDALLLKLLGRVNELPFKESSEEIRLAISKLLLALFTNFKESFYKHFSETIQACSCLLQDKYPESKKQVCVFIVHISKELPELIGMSCRRLLGPLLANCAHAHSRVRKPNIAAIGHILILPKAGEHFKDVFEGIRLLTADKNSEIREEALRTLGLCLEHFGLADLKQNETPIIAELLSGLSDENEKIQQLTRTLLEAFAARRKELFEKFGS